MTVERENKMNDLLNKLKAIQKTKNVEHEAILQVKVSPEIRTKLIKKLKKDNLTYKDLFQSAIEIYLGGDKTDET